MRGQKNTPVSQMARRGTVSLSAPGYLSAGLSQAGLGALDIRLARFVRLHHNIGQTHLQLAAGD